MAADHRAIALTEHASARTAGAIHQAGDDRPVLVDVFGGAIPARGFRTAESGVSAGVTEQREGVGQAHRIVGCDAVELERILPADCERAELLVAETAIDLAVKVWPQRPLSAFEVCRLYGTPAF